ncbi:MAG: hypothetical protein ACE5F9_10135 [Phycisphaerae bacterium]
MALLAGVVGCPAPGGPVAPTPRRRPTIARVTGEQPGLVRLSGVGPIRGFARDRDCTFMHCLELVLAAVGRPIDYDELMGLSGVAFRLQFRAERWDVGNPDPLVGASCLDVLFPAIGLEYDLRIVRRDQLKQARALREAIVRSIDREMPVLAANIMPPEDWGIITGYRRQGHEWLCRSYNGGAEREDRPATGWPTAVLMIESRRPRPSPREAHVASIRRAIEAFETRSNGLYATGRNAFEHWRQMLGAADKPDYIHPNAWTYIGLIDARRAAVRYLRSIAGEFGVKRRHILRAADLYGQETRLLTHGLKDVPSARQVSGAMPPAAVRARQITTLLKAMKLEEQAIDALKKTR